MFVFALFSLYSSAQQNQYRVVQNERVGGVGGFDYVYADEVGRKLYIPRSGNPGKIAVFNLDSLESVGEIPGISAHGVAVSSRSNHAFATSKPVAMWDATTLALIKTIEVEGSPDGILYDPFADTVYVLSHKAPNITLINAGDGSKAGTIDIGGAPEQAVSDGRGRVYVDIEDKDAIAVIDAGAKKVVDTYPLLGKGGTCAGLAMDVENGILFATCRDPQTMVIMNAGNGTILATLPIGQGTDGAAFNPNTLEAFSSQGDGTCTVVREKSPTDFAVEQTVKTRKNAKTLALDTRTNRIFLITADFGPPPAPAAQGRSSSRGPIVPGSFSILVVGQ
jgi:DNA-binding beta-propeller fold protein YncE